MRPDRRPGLAAGAAALRSRKKLLNAWSSSIGCGVERAHATMKRWQWPEPHRQSEPLRQRLQSSVRRNRHEHETRACAHATGLPTFPRIPHSAPKTSNELPDPAETSIPRSFSACLLQKNRICVIHFHSPDCMCPAAGGVTDRRRKDETDLMVRRPGPGGAEFFIPIGRNPLKSPDSKK